MTELNDDIDAQMNLFRFHIMSVADLPTRYALLTAYSRLLELMTKLLKELRV